MYMYVYICMSSRLKGGGEKENAFSGYGPAGADEIRSGLLCVCVYMWGAARSPKPLFK